MGQEGGLYLTLHCHRQNDSRMKMGSSEGHFNVLSIARDQSHATDSVSAQATTFQVRGEPERNRTERSFFCLSSHLKEFIADTPVAIPEPN